MGDSKTVQQKIDPLMVCKPYLWFYEARWSFTPICCMASW